MQTSAPSAPPLRTELRAALRSALVGLAFGLVAIPSPLRTASAGVADPPPRIERLAFAEDGRVRLEPLFPTNQLYALQTSPDLAHWRRVASLAAGNPADGSIEIDPGGPPQAFYRLAREATMFRFGPDHTGRCDTEGIATTNVVQLWKFQTGDHVVSSPAVVGGVVYIGSVDTNFYALEAGTGEELWRFRAGGAIRSSAAVVDGRVYFSSRDGQVYALTAATGQELWRCKIAETNQTASVDNWDYFDSSPALADDVVYIGSGDRKVYAIDAKTGQPIWTFATGSKVRSSPAVVNGVVYVGGLDRYFYALDAATGTNLWKYRVQGNSGFPNGEIYHAPAVADGVVYFGSRDSTLYAVDAATGTNRWRRPVCGGSSWVFNSPSVWSNLVVLGTSIPGYLIGVEAKTGREKWAFSLPLQEYSSPAIAEGIAYFGTGDALSPCTSPAHPRAAPAYFYAVNLATGKQHWRFRVPGHVWSSPAVVEGTVYFGCLDGCVYALR